MDNPLLNTGPLPSFSNIIPEEHVESALKQIICQNRILLADILSQTEGYTWENLLDPLEEMNDRLAKAWAPVSHMHSVVESEALRDAYNACLPLLTEYHSEFMQNDKLYKAIQWLIDAPIYKELNPAQRKVLENELRDFKLAGVNLSPEEKAHYTELQKQLSKLTTQFAENLLDATHGFTLHVTDPDALSGLPEQTLKMAEQNAKQRELSGWVLTLDYPCYSSVMKYLDNRQLRWLMYEAYVTRASDQGPNAGRWDNSPIMEEILKIRHEMANILGFKNFAEYSLVPKMAGTAKLVFDFLNDLVTRSKPAAEKEMLELREFAKTHGIETLESWDLGYFSEKLRQSRYALSQEDLRPYFPINKVLSGLFTVVNRLFGLNIVEKTGVDVWHPQVQFFEVYDEKDELRGYFYTDLYARPHKRDGAWMDDCRMRRILPDKTVQLPIAFLTCNFMRPIGNKPALLTTDDVETLFHEFGHCLHHILTRINYAAISGINGVPWDAVEFPSQFLEHWCFEKDAIELISGHYETNEPLPDTLFNKLKAAKNFQSAMGMLRQLEFSLFDFRIHYEYDPEQGGRIQSTLDDVRAAVCVTAPPTFNRFQHSFSHIFAGGYAAGYYSYKWAEVLSSDAFSLFEEKGLFDRHSGQAFLNNILEQGGLPNPMAAFVAFRGREPQIDALLRHSGLTAGDNSK